MPENLKEGILITSPRSLLQREKVAGACVRKLGLEIPALVDDFADSTEIAYTAWPDRLYVIDRDGHVAFKSDPGPFGFKPALMEKALARVTM
jgi:hypothetical protein